MSELIDGEKWRFFLICNIFSFFLLQSRKHANKVRLYYMLHPVDGGCPAKKLRADNVSPRVNSLHPAVCLPAVSVITEEKHTPQPQSTPAGCFLLLRTTPVWRVGPSGLRIGDW